MTASPMHNVPAPLSSLIGRDDELAVVVELLRNYRLVTLIGPGGVGKTRLAQHTALRLVQHDAVPVVWVELAAVADDRHVIEAVGQGLSPGPGAPVHRATIVQRCRELGAIVIVLDNAEHLLDATAALAQLLLTSCPDLRILATSREPLGVPGELSRTVPSLSLPPAGGSGQEGRFDGGARRDGRPAEDVIELDAYEATRLFTVRARQAQPTLVLDATAVPLVVELCRRLDGLPLAIELAAARVRSMTLERLVAELRTALKVLSTGARAAPSRHRTLIACIGWSVHLLDGSEQAVLLQLGVFQDRFTVDAAVEVVDEVVADDELGPTRVAEILAALVDKGLLRFDHGSGRYEMLETIRQFSLGELDTRGALLATRTRHACYFARRFGSYPDGRSLVHRDALVAEHGDALAALGWSFEAAPELACELSAALADHAVTVGTAASRQIVDWLIDHAHRMDLVPPTAWARAAAAHLISSATIDVREDLLALAPLVEERLDASDRAGQWCVRFLGAYPGMFRGETEPAAALLAEVESQDGPWSLRRWLAGSIAIIKAYCGELDTAADHVDHARRLLGVERVPFRQDTAMHAFSAAVFVAMVRARMEEAMALVAVGAPAAPNPLLTAYAGFGCLVAHVAGRPHDIPALQRWADEQAPVRMAGTLANVKMFDALIAGDTAGAAQHGYVGWQVTRGNGVLQGSMIPLAVSLLIEVGRGHDARTVEEGFGADVELLGSRPWHRMQHEHCRALLAVAVDDLTGAADAAHRQLAVAEQHGFTLGAIDALSLLADLAARGGDGARAARLVGAVRSARQTTGALVAVVVDPAGVEERADQVVEGHPDEHAAGQLLGLAEAISYAQRMRGRRGRPATGWASLTPTEREVATLAAAAVPNAEIGRRLFMSVATVKSHLTHAYAKLGVSNRTELANLRSRQ